MNSPGHVSVPIKKTLPNYIAKDLKAFESLSRISFLRASSVEEDGLKSGDRGS